MKLTDTLIQRLMKISFSAIILQLLYICICIDGGNYMPLPESLTYCAASAALTVAGGFILSFADKLSER